MNKFMSRAFCICILFSSVVVGEIIQRPLNAAMSVGEETVINCSSNTTDALTWIYTRACNSFVGITLTDSKCDITSDQTSHYRTEKPVGFVCNLVVFNALLSHGGCYICGDGLGPGRQSSAFLIVVDSNANFMTNTTDIISEEYITISNSISYGGPSLQPPPLPPSFYWTLQSDPNQNITSYTGTTTTNSTSSYIVVEAQKPDVPPFVCNLFFNTPVNVSQGGAANTPTYRTSWVTTTYKVSYHPENTSISEIMIVCPYDVPVVLTCNASGYPLPTFKWFDLTNGGDSFHKGPTVEINDGGIYQCVASNTIRDVTYTDESMPVNVSDCFTYANNDDQLSTCDPLCFAILVISIYCGLNLLFFTVFIICYGCSKNGRNTMNDRFPWLIKMLPCMNDEGCKCSVWIFYFVLLSIFAAFIFFPVILIMASCCNKKTKKTPQGLAKSKENERNGREARSTHLNTYQDLPRMSVKPNPPSSLNSSGHFQQDPLNRPYPHSSNQQHQPEYWGNSGPYPQNPRNPRPPPRPSPSPLSTGGIVYAELGVDNQPMSRRPIQPIQDGSNTYADIALA